MTSRSTGPRGDSKLIARAAAVAAACLFAACGGSGSPTEETVDPLLVPFVGTWDAESVVVTSEGDSTITVDVIEEGGVMWLNVQPSGSYTLSLSYGGQPIVNTGQLSAQEEYIVTHPAGGGAPETLAYEFYESDRLRLEGPISFPFTSATPTPGELVAELKKR